MNVPMTFGDGGLKLFYLLFKAFSIFSVLTPGNVYPTFVFWRPCSSNFLFCSFSKAFCFRASWFLIAAYPSAFAADKSPYGLLMESELRSS
jgi:hypothetical protein